MAFIGVDLHTNFFTICRLQDDGSEVFETFTLSASALQAFCMSLDADDEIAVEATGNTAWFCDEIRACVGRIVVVNPRQFQVIRKSVNKTDKNDARSLAFFLSKDRAFRRQQVWDHGADYTPSTFVHVSFEAKSSFNLCDR